MSATQLKVLAGMLAAAVFAAIAVGLGLPHVPLDSAALVEPGARLVFTARWLLVPGSCLLAGIARVANRRFFTADAIAGDRPPADWGLEVNLRYNLNTLEQAVLAAIAWLAFAAGAEPHQLALIPILAVLFAIGRIAFWLGYLASPAARAFGFGTTFYPTVALYVWLAARWLAR